MKRLLQENELIPFEAGFPPGRRWLVLAPHPDDETFGPGATLAQAVARGVEVKVVVVTDGAAQGDAAERERESRAAVAALGLAEPDFWRFADRSLQPGGASLAGRLRQCFQAYPPETVMVTSPVELHPDHRALALAVQRVLRGRSAWGARRRPPLWLAAYEVATPLQPNLLVAADPAWEAKTRAAACYAGQLAFKPYERIMEALATHRALTLDGIRRAEAFHVLPARRVARLSATGWARLMGCARGVETRGA